MTSIQKIGLVLFIIGFSIFNMSFFLAENTLSEEKLKAHVNDEKIQLLKSAEPILFKVPHGNFAFVSYLSSAMEKANQRIFDQYGVKEDEIDRIVEETGENLILDDILIHIESEYARNKFVEYGNWLDGKYYGSREKKREDIKNVAENINQYALLPEKGFDKYEQKSLLFSITRTASRGPVKQNPVLFLLFTYVICIVGSLMYILPRIKSTLPGIKNNGIFKSSMKNRGWLGIITGTYLIAFYIFLYFYPEYMIQWIEMVDPVSVFLKGSEAGRFFLYGFIYTLCILVMGVRMMINYRHNKYQVVRTASVMFFQTCFAFLIPEILLRLNKPYFDFKNIWPLDYDFFFDNELNTLIESGGLGIFMLGWGIGLILLGVPIFVYFFGKRWYCSWVCGCGGLAETLGDPYRQLSDKSLKAWRIERWSIHSVLVFAIVMTGTVLYTYFTGSSDVLGINSFQIREVYGAWIGAGFAGVVGTGFYPLMGNRVWCRFGCPLAAYLGFVQRFKSRFRITTNGGQCISCGNCSTYCEMGIDVRWYAQRGQNIIRSSCVGCGICAAVCPRGVLKLENDTEKGRINQNPVLIGNDGVVTNINLTSKN